MKLPWIVQDKNDTRRKSTNDICNRSYVKWVTIRNEFEEIEELSRELNKTVVSDLNETNNNVNREQIQIYLID